MEQNSTPFILLSALLVLSGIFYPVNSCEDAINKYGAKIALPSNAAQFFRGESVNLIISMDSGEAIRVNGKIGGNAIEALKCGSSRNADYDVYLTENAARALSKSGRDSQVKVFISLMKNGGIKIVPHGFMQSLKIKIGEIVLASAG